MTLICRHRVNLPADLDMVDPTFGVEIDLRSEGGELVLEHDPFVPGPRFVEWLTHYRHAFIVLNIKEEGLEREVARVLEERGIEAWAFLDQSFPFLVRSLRQGERRTMVRISEYESVRNALALTPRPQWVWVDSFTGQWPNDHDLRLLHDADYRLMLVSPELQGRGADAEVPVVRRRFAAAGITIDGVCTKRPDLWR